MQQLKMQLRMVINAILDARVHAHGMTEAEAMTLMTARGFQEDGEAAGKWRRAQLTSAQLSTYYVGYTEVADLAADLRAAGCPSAPPTTACSPTAPRPSACSASSCNAIRSSAAAFSPAPWPGRPATAAARRGDPAPAGWG